MFSKVNKLIINKIPNRFINNFSNKVFATKISHPKSLVFNHKKEMDRIHKQITRMKKPSTVDGVIDHKLIEQEFDVDPGLSYFMHDSSQFEFYSSTSPYPINTRLESNSPANAWIRLVIPFDKDEKLRKNYKLLDNDTIRVAKFMELLDFFTGMVAYKYCNFLPSKSDYTLVTASVDKIELFENISLLKPLVITSYPSLIGSSSMEIRADFSSDPDDSDAGFLGTAYFMFAARDAKDHSKKLSLPKCDFTEGKCFEDIDELNKAKLRFEIGAERKLEKIEESHKSLFKTPPSQEESEILHKLYLGYKNFKFSNKSAIDNSEIILQKPIIDTLVEKTLLMHSQNRNVHGKVFGGYIMAMALELAWISAKIHCNYKCFRNICVDTVTFHKPVQVGSIASFKAIIDYVYLEMMHASVEVFNNINGVNTLTTTINVIYLCDEPVPLVVPTTYDCGLKYLEAKRRSERIYSHF